MAAQPPPYAPEPSFPQVQDGYQAVPAQQNKPSAQSSAPNQSDYAPGPAQYYLGQPAQGVPQQPAYYTQPHNSSMQNTNVTVVTQQPSLIPPPLVEIEPKPNNYVVLSIINMLFCFFILGLIALIFSLQVDSAWSSGDYQSARNNSNVAKVLNFVGIGIGIAAWVVTGIITVIVIVLAAAAGSVSENNYY